MRPRRKLLIWTIAVAMGVLLLISAFRLDGAVRRWQYQYRRQNTPVLSRNVTRATDWPAHVIGGLVVAGVAWWRGNRAVPRIVVAMILAAALAGVAAYGLKFSTGRVRPYVKTERVWRGPEARQNFQSFPSGHTAASAAFFAVLLFINWRRGLPWFLIPLFVGFTRIFLGAHYLSDVVAAILLGLLCGWFVAMLLMRNTRAV